MEHIGRLFIILGIAFVALGVVFLYSDHLSFLRIGRLPGDISIKKENFSFYFPLTTCIVISLVVSLILYFLRK